MIDISTFIKNNEIYISEEYFSKLKREYTEDEIIDAISMAIDEYEIPMPKRKISYMDAVMSFHDLMEFDTSTLLSHGPTYSRYEYNHKFGDKIVTQSNIGNIASDHFHQERRFHCDSINAPSPYRSWTQPKFRKGFLKALFSMKFKEVTTQTLRNAIGLRKYIASQFKPSVAKFVYDHFKSVDVLDFSAGWGDRLAGFYASEKTRSYTGIDPNKTLVEPYARQVDLYSSINPKHATMLSGCAEEVLPLNKTFDTVFTSPPYFNIERYTQDDNQSWKRYRKIDIWLNEFLFPVLKQSYGMLEDGGTMIINISDVYSGHKINKICDPMCDFLIDLGATYDGTIGMKLSKRPNSRATKQDGTFVEPMWIFKK